MYYNNLLSIPVLVTFSLLFEDWSSKSLELNLYAGEISRCYGLLPDMHRHGSCFTANFHPEPNLPLPSFPQSS